MKKIIISASVLAALFLNPSCKPKEVVGPAGPAGATGTPGTNGTNGKDGKDGNANVIGSSKFVTTSSDWVNNSGVYSTFYLDSRITQAVVDKGNVLVYYQNISGSWTPLTHSSGKNITYYYFSLGAVTISNYNTDYSANTNPGAKTFRVDIISASN